MNINAHLPWAAQHLPGTHGRVDGPAVTPYDDPELQIVHAFELAAAAYLVAVLGPVMLALGGALSLEAVEGWVETYFMTACLPLALSVIAAALYGLPHALGTRLWSVRLGWTHFALLNTAVLVPLWRIMGEPVLGEFAGARLVVFVVALQAAGLVTMLVNMVETVAHART